MTHPDLIERLKKWSDPAEIERIMTHWDSWRKYIKEGGGGSWPRDAFESILDAINQDASEAIAAFASVAPSGAEPVAVRVKHKSEGAAWQYLPLPLHEKTAAWAYSGNWTVESLYASPQAVPAEDVAALVERLNEKHAAWQKLCDRWIAKGKADGMDIEDDFTALRKTTEGEAAAALARIAEERDAYIKACDDYERDLKRSEAEATSMRRKLEEAERDRDEVIRKSAAYNPTEREGRAIMDEAAALERAEAAERKLEEHRKVLTEARERINRYADTAEEHDLVARIDALEDKP